MGFCDLALYNDSLLAKQAWRLLNEKHTLFHKVFKAKFFPNCSFMDAMESSGRSYAWKSILYGRDVIEKDVRWRIGDGCSIKIWQHHWLPIKHPTRISSPLESMENATVDLLIDADTRSWNFGIIDGLFAPNDADLIKRIPLAWLASTDEMFWPFTQHGNYTYMMVHLLVKNNPIQAFGERIGC